MASSKRSTLHVDGLDETQAKFKRLPREVKAESDELVRDVARFVASKAKAAAGTPAERKAATTIKAQKNSVSIGGGGKRQAAGSMALGTEFGGGRRPSTRQFRNHRGTTGYFFWPSIRSNSTKIKQMWDDMLEEILEDVS